MRVNFLFLCGLLILIAVTTIGCGDGPGPDVPMVGTITINPEPNSIDAPWELVGPNGFTRSASGDTTLVDMAVGNYMLTWGVVAGWDKPTAVAGSVVADSAIQFLGRYARVFAVETLLENLEHPSSMWVKGDKLYFTETAGRNTSYGGKVQLNRFGLTTGTKDLIVDNPENSDAVVVASNGLIYLASYQNTIPGEIGTVSVVNPETGVESHLADVEIAASDMAINSNDDIVLFGSSDLPDAKSLYLFPALDFQNPVILRTGLGRGFCAGLDGDMFYHADFTALYRFIVGQADETLLTRSYVTSTTISETHVFTTVAEFEPNRGSLFRIAKDGSGLTQLVDGFSMPLAVRYDSASGRLFLLDAGTEAGSYKDGKLFEVVGFESRADGSPPLSLARGEKSPACGVGRGSLLYRLVSGES